MISMMFEASRRVSYFTTSTPGFRSLIARSAESTLAVPTPSVLWITWRWRFETSTTSSSTRPIVPTPAAAADEPYRPAARAREVERRRRAEPSGAEQQHLRVEQLELALHADLRQQDVAAVAILLVGVERTRRLYVEAAVLPERDAAGHRGHVVVAEQRLKRVGGEC